MIICLPKPSRYIPSPRFRDANWVTLTRARACARACTRARAFNARARWRKKEVPPVFGGRNVPGEPSESKHYGEIQRGTTPGNHKGTTVANKKNQSNQKESKIKDLNSSWNWKVSSWITSFNNRFQDIQWIISKSLQWYLDICFQCLFSKKMLQNKDFYL